jgi:heme/copper-type cytochrome/quinol oxidase subunit 2
MVFYVFCASWSSDVVVVVTVTATAIVIVVITITVVCLFSANNGNINDWQKTKSPRSVPLSFSS